MHLHTNLRLKESLSSANCLLYERKSLRLAIVARRDPDKYSQGFGGTRIFSTKRCHGSDAPTYSRSDKKDLNPDWKSCSQMVKNIAKQMEIDLLKVNMPRKKRNCFRLPVL